MADDSDNSELNVMAMVRHKQLNKVIVIYIGNIKVGLVSIFSLFV